MATQHTQVLARGLLTPAVALLLVWMIVPLAMTIYFSSLNYSLLDPGSETFAGLDNFRYFLTDPAFLASLQNTLVLVGSVLAITIVLGVPLALLLDQPVIGRSVVRLMVIAPFFVMPTVSALVWKNLLLHPVDEETGRKAINRFGLGTLVYPVVVVIGLFSPVVMLVLYAALTGFYMAEQTAILPSAEDAEDPELEPD